MAKTNTWTVQGLKIFYILQVRKIKSLTSDELVRKLKLLEADGGADLQIGRPQCLLHDLAWERLVNAVEDVAGTAAARLTGAWPKGLWHQTKLFRNLLSQFSKMIKFESRNESLIRALQLKLQHWLPEK